MNMQLLNLLAGEAGFEPTHDGVKVRCLTAWLLPKIMGWDIRVELMTSSATNWRPNQLGQSHHMARCGGLEPPAYCLEGSCSIQLS